jgi:hypothetical protein
MAGPHAAEVQARTEVYRSRFRAAPRAVVAVGVARRAPAAHP